MTSPKQNSVYRRATHALREALTALQADGTVDLAHVLKALQGIPSPSGRDEIKDALASGLGEVITEIAEALSEEDHVRSRSSDEADETAPRRLESLWRAALPLAPAFGASSLTTWVRTVLRFRSAPGLTFLGIARAAADGGLGRRDFRWGEDTNELRDAVAREVLATVAQGASGTAVDDAFRLAGVLGVEFISVDWQEFAEAAASAGSTQSLDQVWAAYEVHPTPLDRAGWRSFIRASIETEDQYLIQRLWATSQRLGSPKSASEWVWFARAAGRFQDPGLLRETLRGFCESGLELRASGWHAFFEAAIANGSGSVDDVWRAWSARRVPLSNRTWHALIREAQAQRRGDLFEAIWEACEGAAHTLSPHIWVGLTFAARECNHADVLRRVWAAWRSSGVALEPRWWSAFVTAAGTTEQADLVEDIWHAYQADECAPHTTFLSALAKAAGLVKRTDLAREAWAACKSEADKAASRNAEGAPVDPIGGSALGSRTWGAMAGAAGRCEDGELLSEVWQAWRRYQERLESEAWASFANAAANTDQHALVSEIWASWRRTGAALSGRSWRTFAGAAGDSGNGALVRTMWAVCSSQGMPIELPTLGAFARAAGITSQVDLVEEIWAACQGTGNTPGSRTWGALAVAAASTGSAALSREFWAAWRSSGAGLAPKGLAAFASAAGKAKDGELLESIWQACRETSEPLGPRTWDALAEAAGLAERGDLLHEIWTAWSDSGEQLDSTGWGTLAVAASDADEAHLLSEIWKAWQATGVHPDDEMLWGRMAGAAERAECTDVLEEVVARCLGLDTPLSNRTWGSIADSAGNAGLPDLLQRIWQRYRELGMTLDAPTAGSFANAAKVAHGSALLTKVFDAWRSDPGTLVRGEHATWGSLLESALFLENEELFLRIFNRLESLYDPIRLKDRGSLQDQLWTMTHNIESPEIRGQVTETLQHLRLDLERCFWTLDTIEPAGPTAPRSGRFEGAARCLMTWLVNSYFHNDPVEFERKLAVLVDRTLALKSHRSEAWHAMLCRGRGAFAGCLTARATKCFERFLAPIRSLSDEDLAAALEQRDGLVFERIRRFYLYDVDTIPTPQLTTPIPADAAARRLEPVIIYLIDNQLDFLNGRPGPGPKHFFGGAWKLLLESRGEELSRRDWMNVLRMLLDRMTLAVWDHVGRAVKDEVHAHKNEMETLGRMLRDAKRATSHRQIVQAARQALTSLSTQQLGRFPVKASVLINVSRYVRSFLLSRQPKSRTVEVDLSVDRILVGGCEGAYRRLIRPLFRELRANAEGALAHLPPSEQAFRVRLYSGTGPEHGFAVLEVSNTYKPDAPVNPFSTRRGQRTIQMLATYFRSGNHQGYAWSETDTDHNRHFHTWRIFMPRWEDSVVEANDEAI